MRIDEAIERALERIPETERADARKACLLCMGAERERASRLVEERIQECLSQDMGGVDRYRSNTGAVYDTLRDLKREIDEGVER